LFELSPELDRKTPVLFCQAELNDLVRDLALSKESAELLGSRLKEKNLLSGGTTFSWFRHREAEFLPYFGRYKELVYCKDIPGLMSQLGETNYKSDDWRLFLDSSKKKPKGRVVA
jgi:hypothetical protein